MEFRQNRYELVSIGSISVSVRLDKVFIDLKIESEIYNIERAQFWPVDKFVWKENAF